MKLIKHTATIIVCLGCVSCIWRTPELMVIDIPEPTEITESSQMGNEPPYGDVQCDGFGPNGGILGRNN